MIRTVFSRTRGEFVVIPVRNSPYLRTIGISTRKSNIIFGNNRFNTDKNRDYVTNPPIANGYLCGTTFSSNFEGDVPILLRGGKSDVFSIFISERYASGSYRHWLNIQDFAVWIGQFPNIYSFLINTGLQGVDTDIIKGDLSQIPNSLESFKIQSLRVINRTTDIFLNISNFSPNSKLKYLNFEKDLSKFSGDLKFIPPMCNYFKLMVTQGGNAISYSGGKIWASNFDALYLPLALSNADNDRLLIDMAATIVSAVGEKTIYLKGNRTVASDYAVTYLQSLGFIITINRI